MKKRILMIFLCACMMTSLIVGCGAKETSKSGDKIVLRYATYRVGTHPTADRKKNAWSALRNCTGMRLNWKLKSFQAIQLTLTR